jgi:phosphoribosylanthranilate isomerase
VNVRVKVCGVRRLDDARLAAELGASAIGLIFWPGSSRAVDVDSARAIVAALPPFVTTVGVFVNQSREDVLGVAQSVGLDAVQLHGDEDPTWYSALPRRVIKAVAVGDGFDVRQLADVPASATVLLDAHDPLRRGGTGRVIDWTVAAAAARTRPVILSGGLTAENVQAAVDTVQPYAVDVASGVESAPGIKDAAKLRAFFSVLNAR